MKSVKLYFSLLLSAVMLAVAVPAMAQEVENIDVAPVAEDVIVAEAEQLDVVAPVRNIDHLLFSLFVVLAAFEFYCLDPFIY